jgi:predicted Zn-dependent protease
MWNNSIQQCEGGNNIIDNVSNLQEISSFITKTALELGADESEVVTYSEEYSTTRYNNFIHQNIATTNFGIYITVVVEKNKMASILVSSREKSRIKEALRKVIKIARVSRADPNYKHLPTLRKVDAIPNLCCKKTVELPPVEKAEKVRTIIDSGLDYDKRIHTIAGFFVNGHRQVALANSHNTDLFCDFSIAELQVNSISSDMESSGTGYSAKLCRDITNLDYDALVIEAVENSVLTLRPKKIQPEEYKVVLKPYAVATLLGILGDGFSSESVREGNSFLVNKLGQQIFDEQLTIVDNGRDKASATATPFDGEGVPKQSITLVKNGVIESLCYDTYTANLVGRESTGHKPQKVDRQAGCIYRNPIPMNQIIHPGSSSLDDLISEIKLGILITRLDYVKFVSASEAVLSGMTRDGTYLIRNGEIRHPVKNLRFTDSMLKALSNITAIGDISTVEKRLREHTGLLSSVTVPAISLDFLKFTGISQS